MFNYSVLLLCECLFLHGLHLPMYLSSATIPGVTWDRCTPFYLAGTVCSPRYMRLSGEFNVRGGIYTTVVVEHRAPDWQPPTPVALP